MRLFALRGAVSVEADDADQILEATERLMREIIERNALATDRMVSCIFTTTPDLTAQFPAVAARNIGLSSVPLLCAQEIPVRGALPRIIRVLVHHYAPDGHESKHVYLDEARALRLDLAGAQESGSMATTSVTEGDGYAVGSIDGIGDGPGFRKIRRAPGVEHFGVNAVVLPPGVETGFHYHYEQQELYIVLSGTLEIRFGDGTSHRLEQGGLARV